MCDITLYCNVKKCRKILNATDDGIIWITRCSHAFCNDDGIHLSTTAAKYVPCPACKTQLDLKHDIVRKETNPSEMWKSTILAGSKFFHHNYINMEVLLWLKFLINSKPIRLFTYVCPFRFETRNDHRYCESKLLILVLSNVQRKLVPD